MFEIKVSGVEQLLNKLNTWGGQIKELQQSVPQELVTWQRDDMRRKYPNMIVATSADETSAATQIWPTSRTADPSRRRKQPRQQGPKQYRIGSTGPVVRSNRPILRVELQEKLHDRMLALTSEAMEWP
jgi:hypothetical protein